MSLRRTHVAEQALRAATGAFVELVDDRFTEWGLTPTERDVAIVAVKGLNLFAIARLRTTSEGTIKAQTNAIYRKAGFIGRPQLLRLFVDDLMSDGILPTLQTSSTA
jgi:DNA-binding CsgD family transcriptional regulator